MRYVRALTNEQRAFLSTSMKEDASFRAGHAPIVCC